MISDDEAKRIVKKVVSKKFKHFNSTALNEAENNYALSVCYRQSFIAELDWSRWNAESQVKWYRINEPDIWQERIMQNYKELKPLFQCRSDYISYIESSDIESSCSDTENE